MFEFMLIAAGVWLIVAWCFCPLIIEWAVDTPHEPFAYLITMFLLVFGPMACALLALGFYDASVECAKLSQVIDRPTAPSGLDCIVEVSKGVWIDKSAVVFDTPIGRK